MPEQRWKGHVRDCKGRKRGMSVPGKENSTAVTAEEGWMG